MSPDCVRVGIEPTVIVRSALAAGVRFLVRQRALRSLQAFLFVCQLLL
jgi:hypothetical protein